MNTQALKMEHKHSKKEDKKNPHNNDLMLYKNVTIMFLASIFLSYIFMTVLIYQNRTVNLNKIYSSLLMGFLMALVELLMFIFMMHRYDAFFIILAFIFLTIIIILTEAIRKQYFITEKEFMKSMIEHHQMGIDMALAIKKRGVKDTRLIPIVDNIIISQKKEIDQMREILNE